MATRNPDIIDGSGRRQIAAHYYPEIGPYASGSYDTIEYQLLLMKYSGIDGLLIDWPGTINAWDYPQNKRNSEEIIRGCERIGLDFAIVYEDHNIQMAYDAGFITDKIGTAQADMGYLKDVYFNKPNYIRINGQPLLLVFGPQTFFSGAEWGRIFEPFSGNSPTFLTLWYQVSNLLTRLQDFFQEIICSNIKLSLIAVESIHGFTWTFTQAFVIFMLTVKQT